MDHADNVERWLGDGFAALPVEQQLAALERGFTAVYLRARDTLGDVTLAAIGERVLAHAQERFAFLADAVLDREGLRCADVRAPSATVLSEAVRYLLLELLTILGRLTAEILSPALHDALRKTPRPSAVRAGRKQAASKRKRNERALDKRSKKKKSRSPRGDNT